MKKFFVSQHPQFFVLLSIDNILFKVEYFNSIHFPSQTIAVRTNNTLTTIEVEVTSVIERVDDKLPFLAARIDMSASSVYSLSITDNVIPIVERISNAWGSSE